MLRFEKALNIYNMKKITTLLLMLLLMATAANAKYTYWGYAGKAAVDLPYGSIGTRQGKAAIYIPAEVHRCTRV